MRQRGLFRKRRKNYENRVGLSYKYVKTAQRRQMTSLFYTITMKVKMSLKNTISLVAIILNLSLVSLAQADGNCYNIDDIEKRRFCLGLSGKDSCYAIDDTNLRQQCLGQTKIGSCYDIDDPQGRAFCLGRTEQDSCYMIDDPEERAMCQNNCYAINDPDLRETCLSSK